jgi:hypothetical protein
VEIRKLPVLDLHGSKDTLESRIKRYQKAGQVRAASRSFVQFRTVGHDGENAFDWRKEVSHRFG